MERDHNNKLSGLIELDDAYLGGERSGCKPGRCAAGKTPFVAAVESTGDHCPIRIKLSVVKGFRTEAIKSWSQQHLTGAVPLSPMAWCALMPLSSPVACMTRLCAAAGERLSKNPSY